MPPSSPLPTSDATVSEPWDAASFGAAVQSVLDDFLDQQSVRIAPLGPDAERLLAAARVAVRGGKRFRAAFCWWGYQAVAPVTDTQALTRACAALELLHASALVHDDFMDASDTRRGHPSTHRVFAEEHAQHRWPGDSDQYGAAAAILLGDLLLSWADELLRRCGLPWTATGPALDVFDLCRSEVIAGQFLDVSVQARGHADVETAMTVLRYKSAKYSIERPLHVGAALAGGDHQALAALSGFGLPLGEAFQLRDDLLGVYGDPTETGKPAGDDLAEGKRTVLVALALEAAPPTAAAEIEDSLGRSLTTEQVDRVRRIITDVGAQAQVERKIEELEARALVGLERAGLDPQATAALRQLATAVTRRTV